MAVDKRFNEAPQKILEIVDEKGWGHLLTDDRRLNALHLAPKCKKEFCEQLLKRHPELLKGVDKDGNTILHTWVKIGQLWPFEYVLKNAEFDRKWRSYFVNLMSYLDFKDRNNPIHIIALCNHEATHQIIKLLVESFQEEHPSCFIDPMYMVPWWNKNKIGEGSLHLAIRSQNDQQIALYLLSLYQKTPINDLLDFYTPNVQNTLFLAIMRNFFQLVKMILTRLNKASWAKYLKGSANGRSVLHLASHCTDRELGRWLVKEAPMFIVQPDSSGITPLDEASTIGATWIVEAMLEQDPSAFNKAPLAWVKACENGHVSVIRIFIEYCPEKFSDHCIHHQDSPLHHIKLRNLMGYEEFLNIPYMKDLINLQDAKGETPLHKAIKDGKILLAETLLNMDKIKYNIKDDEDKTARYLLEQLCKEQPQWFKNIILSTEDQSIRGAKHTICGCGSISHITFTAGFTLPGGFNQDTGEAILAKKTAFLVFLISDTFAMCFSMLVLICLIWSMVFEPNKSLFLIDRSVGLLRVALYSTLLAFMTGVYIVISPKSLWAAILVVAMCSLVGISANMTFLYKVLAFFDKLTPSANKERKDPIRLMEQVSTITH
ncbi:Serine/threonine-protein phosphatase 6 regulatory ankyrin repeat subunit C [Bienertia sinuspersici]